MLLKIACLLIFVMALISLNVVGQTTVDTQRTIRVVMDNDYAPYVFQTDKGKLQGILVDQWREWEKKTGIRADIHGMNWNDALQQIGTGKSDVIDCIVKTPGRLGYFDFTPSYTTVKTSIFFHKDISGITDLASLKGFPVGAKTGDQNIDDLRANGVTTILTFPNYEAIIKAAKEHKINVFLVDDLSALYLLHKMGIGSEFRHTAPVSQDEVRRAVRKGDTAILRIVSDGFAAIEKAKLKQIDEKWFGLSINTQERYLEYVVYILAVAFLLIIGLIVWNRTLRKKILRSTAKLRKSEYNIRLIINTIPIMAWTFRSDGVVDFANQRWLDYAGEGAIEHPNRIVHPEHLQGIMERWLLNRVTGKAFEDEMRLCRSDGQYRWFLVRTAPLRDEQGNLVRWYGVAIDIEDSKRAKETLNKSYEEIRRLTRHLQKVREEERTSIAREIHDELGQQLTGIKMDVAWIDKKTPPEETDIKSKLKNIISLLDGSNRSVRKILNELRTGILDDDGLLEALEFQSRQFTERTGIPVEFTTTETAIKLPEEIATCIFRVYQESLTNIIRYAEANKVLTSLKLADNLIIVTIRDDGKGFNTLAVENDTSFGILGMKERIAAVHGTFELVSAAGKGTSIIISIPYKTQ